jgi:hypothetical protein
MTNQSPYQLKHCNPCETNTHQYPTTSSTLLPNQQASKNSMAEKQNSKSIKTQHSKNQPNQNNQSNHTHHQSK